MWSTLKSFFAESESDQNSLTNSVHALESIEELNSALEQSSQVPVFVFKHSSRCSISSMALREYMDFARRVTKSAVAKCYVLDLVRFRDISTTIAERLGVVHQSPQAILIHQNQPLWHKSHGDISSQSLQAALEQIVREGTTQSQA